MIRKLQKGVRDAMKATDKSKLVFKRKKMKKDWMDPQIRSILKKKLDKKQLADIDTVHDNILKGQRIILDAVCKGLGIGKGDN